MLVFFFPFLPSSFLTVSAVRDGKRGGGEGKKPKVARGAELSSTFFQYTFNAKREGKEGNRLSLLLFVLAPLGERMQQGGEEAKGRRRWTGKGRGHGHWNVTT